MPMIHDDEGKEIADIVLSERQLELLNSGAAIHVQYHTPQLLRSALGEHSGVFLLMKKGERITTDKPETIKRYAALVKSIAAARGEH